MHKRLIRTKNGYLVKVGKKVIERFDKLTEAEAYLGWYRAYEPVMVERQVIAHIQENNEPEPNYRYRIVQAIMVRGKERMYPTNELFVTIERAEKVCDFMNADPRRRLNERYKIATICQ